MKSNLLTNSCALLFAITTSTVQAATLVFTVDPIGETISMSGQLTDTTQFVSGPDFYQIFFNNGIAEEGDEIFSGNIPDTIDLVTGNFSFGNFTIWENGRMSFYFQTDSSSTISLTGTENPIAWSSMSPGVEDFFTNPPAGSLTAFLPTPAASTSTIPIVVVPEPSVPLLAVIAGAMACLRRRRQAIHQLDLERQS